MRKLVTCDSLQLFNYSVSEILECDTFKNIKNNTRNNYTYKELTTIYLHIILPKWRLNLSKPLTNNLAESCNNKLKSLVGRLYVSPTCLESDLRILVQNQFINVKKAFNGEGGFMFPHYQSPQINELPSTR